MDTLDAIAEGLREGKVVPYLGPGVLGGESAGCPLPDGPGALVMRLAAMSSVPHKIRNNLGAAAQFIENFKHRKTLRGYMSEIFSPAGVSTDVHLWLRSQPRLPLVVHAWYDDLVQRSLSGRESWGIVQGLSQSEHFGDWYGFYSGEALAAGLEQPVTLSADSGEGANGEEAVPRVPEGVSEWDTLLYEPLGSVAPGANFLVSDTDYVEVLTEIDIQTPIPDEVQRRRTDRSFLFLGCRFSSQVERIFAFEIMKRSSERHWAVLPEEPTRNELRFCDRYGVERLDMGLEEFLRQMGHSAG